MRRRGCLISVAAILGLSLVCCLLLFFVGVPRFQGFVADGIGHALSTQVAEQVGPGGIDLQPGTYTISMTELEQQLANAESTQGVEDIAFSAENGEIVLEFGSGGQTFGYSGVPVAEDGRLVLTDVTVEGGLPDWIFPADTLAGAIESGVNSYFDAQELDIVAVTAENDELVIEAQ